MSWALITGGILKEVELMIVFGVPPRAGRDNLCNDLLALKDEA